MQRLVVDSKSYTPGGFLRSAIFVAKEYLHRRRAPSYRFSFASPQRQQDARAYFEVLDRDGIVVLPSYFQGQQLRAMQAALDRAVDGRPAKGVVDAQRHEDALGCDPVILEAALDDFLLEIIARYYGKPFGIGRADATRLMPTPPKRSDSYQWHHDTRGRQIHMMILLSDVSPDGQRMSYLRGTHNIYYDRFRGSGHGSRFETELRGDPSITDKVFELVGPAGTVGLFDSNGLHSGNRNDREKRDCFLFCYVSHRRHFKPVSCPRSLVMGLSPAKRELVQMNPMLTLLD